MRQSAQPDLALGRRGVKVARDTQHAVAIERYERRHALRANRIDVGTIAPQVGVSCRESGSVANTLAMPQSLPYDVWLIAGKLVSETRRRLEPI